jgi:heme exporter protein A
MPSHDGSLLLAARGLRHSFGRLRVLRDISLSLGAGEALAVVGPNGAGKSTLLRLLAGLTQPTAGQIRILGQPLGRGSHESRRSIGLLSHQSFLYNDLTLLENLTLVARLYGLSGPRSVAAEALESAGLSDRAAELPRRLSRGLVQPPPHVSARLHHPRLLLLDEPFTSLDANASTGLRAELARRLAEGTGIVIVTHQLPEVWELATRVAVLVDGSWAADEPRTGALESFLPRYHGWAGA